MIALALVYIGLAAIAGATLAVGRAPLVAKTAIILCVPALAFAVWRAAQPPTGWAATVTPPKTAEFLWGYVREPDALTHSSGEIVLWLVPAGSTEPRAYRTPYSRRTHEQVAAAEQAVKQHGRVGVQRSSRGTAAGLYRFYTLPPPAPPTK